MAKEPLHRRKISSALQANRGWICTTTINGFVFVRPRGADLHDGFGAEVRAEIEAMKYTLSSLAVQHREGRRWIRVSTPETLAQVPRGEHMK